VIVEVYDPARVLEGIASHQPTGLIEKLPMPDAAAALKIEVAEEAIVTG
jgi:hypothetical protein